MAPSKEYIDSLAVLAERLYHAGKLDDAETICFALRRYAPQDVAHYKLSGAVQAKKKQYQFAFNCFRAGLLVDRLDAELWLCLGKTALHLQKLEEATIYFGRAKELAGKSKIGLFAERLKGFVQ